MTAADRQKPAPGELFLDHVSHFVRDLDAAAALLERLGFVVTARSAQVADGRPAGASNRCVMLEQGYVEILSPTHDTPVAERMRARMERFIGVHLACFGTPDAEAEHARLAAHDFAPQPLVDLQRKIDEGARTARFKVVRPAPERMPEGRVQYVQQLTPEALWTEANLAHTNGVRGLAAVFVVADDPADVAARWARFTGLLPRREGALAVLEAARGRVLIGSRSTMTGLLGAAPQAPALAGYALDCRHPEAFVARCLAAGLEVRPGPLGQAVLLPEVLGGAWVI